MRDAEVVQHPAHDGVHHLLDRGRAMVEGRIGRQNDRTRQQEQFIIPHVNQVQRRLARDQDQLSLLLQRHVGRAQQHILAESVGDPPQRAHGAGDDDHGVHRIGTAGEGSVHAAQSVRLRAFRQPQAAGQFLGQDDLGIAAQHEVDFVLTRIQMVQQPLGIKRAAGAGDGNEDFHGVILAIKPPQIGQDQLRQLGAVSALQNTESGRLHGANRFPQPMKIFRLQCPVRQRIAAVGIETRRDRDHVRLEILQGLECLRKNGAVLLARRGGRDGKVEAVAAPVFPPRSGIGRILVN